MSCGRAYGETELVCAIIEQYIVASAKDTKQWFACNASCSIITTFAFVIRRHLYSLFCNRRTIFDNIDSFHFVTHQIKYIWSPDGYLLFIVMTQLITKLITHELCTPNANSIIFSHHERKQKKIAIVLIEFSTSRNDCFINSFFFLSIQINWHTISVLLVRIGDSIIMKEIFQTLQTILFSQNT